MNAFARLTGQEFEFGGVEGWDGPRGRDRDQLCDGGSEGNAMEQGDGREGDDVED